MKKRSVLALAFFSLLAAGAAGCSDDDALPAEPARGGTPAPAGPAAPGAPAAPAANLCDRWADLGMMQTVVAQIAPHHFGPGQHFYLYMFGPDETIFLTHIRPGRAPLEEGFRPGTYTLRRQASRDCGLCINASVGTEVGLPDFESVWNAEHHYMATSGTLTVSEPTGAGAVTFTLENVGFDEITPADTGWNYVEENPCTARLDRVSWRGVILPAAGGDDDGDDVL